MPLYDYRCTDHGDFEKRQPMIDHARAECPTCGEIVRQVLLGAPGLNVESMADAGMPGALETSGNRMEERHKAAGQDHHYWRDDISTKDTIKLAAEMVEAGD